jgi:site-specific DNA-methyltransferase (adenine-specific)
VKPYYEDEAVMIYHGDCREVLLQLTEPVDLVLTDPPYNVSARNGRGNTTIGRVKRKHVITGARADGSESYREIKRDFGEWDYDWDATPLLSETRRLLCDGGSLIAFTSEFLLAAYLQSGLDHRCLLYWLKANPAPNFRGLYQRSVEMAVWQTKGGSWTFNASGATKNTVAAPIVSGWRCQNTNEKRRHPTQKPLEVVSHWMQIHSNPGDLILDPFMGSGTTLRAAKDLGRRAIGIEIEERYCEIAAKRMAQAVMPLPLVPAQPQEGQEALW